MSTNNQIQIMSYAEMIEAAMKAVQLYAETHPRPTHVNLGQAADMLGVSRVTLRKIIASGKIRLNSFGLIPIEQIDNARAAPLTTRKVA
jgi:predicted HTH domain antitoxin